MGCFNNVKCSGCRSHPCEIRVKIIMYYILLGKLRTSSHKTLYAMMCRKLYREMRELGHRFSMIKSEAI